MAWTATLDTPLDESFDRSPGSTRPPSTARLVWDALTAPGEAFAAVERVRVVPLLSVLLIFSTLLAWASVGPAKEYTLFLVDQAGKTVTPDKEYLFLMTVTVATLSAGCLTPLLLWLLESGLIRFGGLFSSVKVRFRTLFAMAVLAGVPMLAGNAVKAILIHLRPAADFVRVQTGLVFLVPEAAETSLAYQVLAQLDPFMLWSLALVGLGIARLYRVGLGRALALVAGGWAALLGVGQLVRLIT